MTKRSVILSIFTAAVLLVPAVSAATEGQQSRKADKKQAEEKIFGSQLMTKQERAEHRTRLRSLNTSEEREAYRLEHHNRMQERARERGLALPDEPPARGGGMGPRGGMGKGGRDSY